MNCRRRANILAIAGAVAVFAVSIWLLRRPGIIPFGAAGATYVGLLLTLWPRRPVERPKPLPENVSREDFDLAIERLRKGAARLRAYIREAPVTDAPLFARMADLLDQIRAHHLANPAHTRLTRTFIRHTLVQMIEQVTDYVALVRRTGPGQEDRLAEISRQFETFVPALEKIDKACLDNDLTALEISVDVLGEQMRRKR